ncbi:MAG: hypothetical protein KJO43_14840 [Phycisphaerae bacterium]|nr:hypothetical protein [Phycisphaerae bacterium]
MSMTRSTLVPAVVATFIVVSLGVLPCVHADDPPAKPVPATPDDPPKDSPPSLDDLLGLDEAETGDDTEDVADRAAQEELERRLAEEQIGDAFTVAIEKMGAIAEQLDEQFDTGLGTQRLQEEVLEKLQFLLEQAKQQKSMNQSSSSSSSSQSSQRQQQPGKQPQSSPPPQQGEASTGDGQGGSPSRRDGDLNRVLEESRTEWGALPARVRDMLLQGRKEKFSSLYEEMTREYYRRLAEEGSS